MVGVRDHFPICGTRIHYHALVIDMAHAIGAGILAPSEAIDVCFGKHQSVSFARRGWGFQLHRRAAGLRI